MINRPVSLLLALALAGVWMNPQPVTAQSEEDPLNVLFIAGRPSHGYGAHEHYAGCVLLAKSLEAAFDNIDVKVIKHGWPEDADAFDNVDAIVIYSDGQGGHPAMKHRDQVDQLAANGKGIVCIHYSVEMLPGESGEDMMRWIGGNFEAHWSVNPHWQASFESFPDHPVTRGVTPFAIQDEWYFHIRFLPEMRGVTPILSAVPPESTMARADGPHEGNPHVRQAVAEGKSQHVAWAVERPDGGRGFGFTGGHFHWNWADENFRRVVLNAIVWTAGGEVPEKGVSVSTVDLAALKQNQDFPQPDDLSDEEIRKRFRSPKNPKSHGN